MSCHGKSTYSKRDAQTVLNRLIRHGQWNHKEPGRIYECHYCNGWHITHEVDRLGGASYDPKLKHADEWKKFLGNE